MHMAMVPPTTRARCPPVAPRSSPKKSAPQRMPSKLFEFHRGKAMLKPTSRMA